MGDRDNREPFYDARSGSVHHPLLSQWQKIHAVVVELGRHVFQ